MNNTTQRFSRRSGESVRDANYASALHCYGRRDSKATWAACIAIVAVLIIVGWR
jgi:hypothetical protein